MMGAQKLTELSYSMADGHAKSGFAERLSSARQELRELEGAYGMVPLQETFLGGVAADMNPACGNRLSHP